MFKKLPGHAAAILAMVAGFALAQQPATGTRVWTAINGQKFHAKLVGVEGSNGVFQLADGKITRVALQHLSQADQASIRTTAAGTTANPATKPIPGSPVAGIKPAEPARPRNWPGIVEVPTNSIEITIA